MTNGDQEGGGAGVGRDSAVGDHRVRLASSGSLEGCAGTMSG